MFDNLEYIFFFESKSFLSEIKEFLYVRKKIHYRITYLKSFLSFQMEFYKKCSRMNDTFEEIGEWTVMSNVVWQINV